MRELLALQSRWLRLRAVQTRSPASCRPRVHIEPARRSVGPSALSLDRRSVSAVTSPTGQQHTHVDGQPFPRVGRACERQQQWEKAKEKEKEGELKPELTLLDGSALSHSYVMASESRLSRDTNARQVNLFHWPGESEFICSKGSQSVPVKSRCLCNLGESTSCASRQLQFNSQVNSRTLPSDQTCCVLLIQSDVWWAKCTLEATRRTRLLSWPCPS